MNDQKKIKLLIIAPQLSIGGGETLVKDIFLNVNREKFEVKLCVFNYGNESIFSELSEKANEITVLEKSKISRLTFICKLVRVIKEFRPEVITTWDFSGNVNGRLAAWMAGFPFIVPQVNSNMGLGKISTFRDYLISGLIWLERFAARFDAGMIVISNSIKADTCKRFKIPEDRISVVYCGVNTEYLKPCLPELSVKRECNIPADAKVVSIIARLAAIKNHKMFLRAARNICQCRKDIYFLVVGLSGTTDYGDKDNAGNPLDNMDVLKKLAQEYGILSNVIFAGSRRDVREILSITDVYAMTSWNEGLNNSILEAMSAGKPIVATAVGGMRETFEEGKSGYFVASDDDQAMAVRIVTLMDDPQQCKSFGAAARQRAVGVFSIPVMMEQNENIYHRTASGKWSLLNLFKTGYAFKFPER